MTILRVTVADEQADSLKKLLREVPFIKSIEEEHALESQVEESSYERIKKILDAARGKSLFKEIDDPSEWQRKIRKEWDRDF